MPAKKRCGWGKSGKSGARNRISVLSGVFSFYYRQLPVKVPLLQALSESVS